MDSIDIGARDIRARGGMMEGEGFLRRWSRLKGGNVQEPPQSPADADAGTSAAGAPAAAPTAHTTPAPASSAALPTLEDAMRLTPESDYSAFVAQGVDKAVRRLALQKLFADPHFNQLDGLDIYMGDYNRADPLPAAMLAALRQAQGFLQKERTTMEQDTSMADRQPGDRHDTGDGDAGGQAPAADATGEEA